MSARARMLDRDLRGRGISSPSVLASFAAVPREEFVRAEDVEQAYADAPLDIGSEQTISQPYVVALMAEAMALRGDERVLEIGTGSGYAAAIFARLAAVVDTVEYVQSLCAAAAQRLARLQVANVRVHCGDGSRGWPEHAPYDAIAVAAAAPAAPKSLLAQLAVGGRLVLPVGSRREQRLVRIERRAGQTFEQRDLGEVRFVPLLGEEGWAHDERRF